MKNFLYVLSLMILMGGATAHAAEEKKPAGNKAKNPFVEDVEKFTESFSDINRRHFIMVISNYNLIKVVETVEGDIKLATDKCSEVNPEMKEALAGDYTAWSAAISPVMKDAKGNIENMILAQEYAKPKEIRNFFKKIDTQRAEKDKEAEKVPVTSKEACQHLQKTMGKTQKKMTSLLKSTLVSLPQQIQGEADKEKADAAKKADADAKAAGEAAKVKEEAEEKAEEKAPEAEKPTQAAKPAGPAEDL